MKPRKQPLRRCCGCQEMKNKKELIRVVRGEDGVFRLDFTGKAPGRGAYICPQPQCLERAQKTKGFERSFKTAVPREVYESLKQELEERNEP